MQWNRFGDKAAFPCPICQTETSFPERTFIESKRMKTSTLLLLTVSWITVVSNELSPLRADDKVTFDDHVKPILAQRCAACHNASKKSGDLDVTNFTSLMIGGGSGAVIEPGDAGSSYLYALVTHEDSPEMPPDSEKIPAPEIEALQKWIDGGALENNSSKAMLPKKKKLAAVAVDSAQRPSVIPNPCRLSLEVDLVPHRSPVVTALATSPWAPLTAIGSAQQVLVYDNQTQRLIGVLDFPEGQINVLKFSRSGSLLLAAGGRAAANGVAIAWDIRTGERVIEITGEIDAVMAADLSNDHSLVALGGSQKWVHVYDSQTGKLKHELKKHTDWIQAIEFSPDGVLLATGDRSGGLLVWEAITGREYLDLRGHQGSITDLSWRIDSNVLASGSQDANIKLWELENGTEIKNWGAHGGGVTDIEMTRDARIVSAGRDNHAKIFDQNGTQLKAYNLGELSTAVTHCDETDRVIASNFAGQVRIFNVADDADLGEISAGPSKLAERAAMAAARHGETKAAFDAASTLVAESQSLLAAKQLELADLQKAAQEMTTAYEQLATQVSQVSADYESQQTQLSSAQQIVEKLTPGLSNLTQAIEALDRAQSTMQSQQLETSHTQLVQLRQQHQTQLNENIAAVEQLTPKVATLETELSRLSEQQTTAKTALDQTNQQLAAANAAVEALTPQLTERQTALAAVEPSFSAALAEHERLQTALKFESEESVILASIDQAWQAMESQAEAIASANEALALCKSAVAEKQQEMDAVTTQIEAWNVEKTTHLEQQTIWTQQQSEMQQAIMEHEAKIVTLAESKAKLTESVAALQAALAIDAADETLKASVQNLTQLIGERNELSQSLRMQIETYKQQIVDLAAQIAAAQASQVALDQSIADAQTQRVALDEHLQPLLSNQTEAETKIAELTSDLESLQSAYEQNRGELLKLRGAQVVEN